MKEHIVILGGLDESLVLLEELKGSKCQTVVGFLIEGLPPDSNVGDVPVLGSLDSWVDLPRHYTFITAQQEVKESPNRAKVLELEIPEERWATFVHPTAALARDVTPGYGSYIGPYVVIQPGVKLGKFISIQPGVTIGHDCQVKDFVFIGPNSCICGGCVLELGAQISSCSTVSNNVNIGEGAIVSLGSAVLKSTPSYSLVLGNPAKVERSLKEE